MALLDFLNPLKILTGPLERITDKIADAYLAKMKAATDKEKIAADERIASLERVRDVLIADTASGDRTNSRMRAAIAAPVAILLWKVLVWDKALGQWTGGSTDALDPNLWNVTMVVIGFYFAFSAVKLFRTK